MKEYSCYTINNHGIHSEINLTAVNHEDARDKYCKKVGKKVIEFESFVVQEVGIIAKKKEFKTREGSEFSSWLLAIIKDIEVEEAKQAEVRKSIEAERKKTEEEKRLEKERRQKELEERKRREEEAEISKLTGLLDCASSCTGNKADDFNKLLENFLLVLGIYEDPSSQLINHWELRLKIFDQCLKGWFRDVYEIMMQRQTNALLMQMMNVAGAKGSGDKTTHLGLAANLMTMAAMSRAVSAIEDNTEKISEGF